MDVKIIQIMCKPESSTIYGLGDDNNVYMWGYKYQEWEKTWDEKPREATAFIPPAFNDNSPRLYP